MNSRFEQAITAGVIAGAIALAGCASGGGGGSDGKSQEPDSTAPALESALAYSLLRGGGDWLVLTFSEPVQLTDAEEAASAFRLAENVGAISTFQTFTSGNYCEGPCPTTYTYYVAPFAACSTATIASLTLQCANETPLSDLVPTASVSADDSTKLIFDYNSTAGFPSGPDHGTEKLRLRYTSTDDGPVQDLAGNSLESFGYPDSDVPGNVEF